MTTIARPPSAMIAKTAFIAVGGPPYYMNILIHGSDQYYSSDLFFIDHTMVV
jgi:hypothetical protein